MAPSKAKRSLVRAMAPSKAKRSERSDRPAKGVVKAAAAGAVAASTAGALTSVGFTTIGPAAGSYAAAWMSSTAAANGGSVPAGSLYSAVQATAMGGGLLLGAPTVLAVGAVAGAKAALWKAWF